MISKAQIKDTANRKLGHRGSNTDSTAISVLAEIGHCWFQNRPLTETAPPGLKRCPDALLSES
jgi:hypothetical protein